MEKLFLLCAQKEYKLVY